MQPQQSGLGLPSTWDDRHWTAEEDRVLLLHARQHGTKRWGDLDASGLLPKRDNKACCNRFLFLRKRFVEERALISVSPTKRDVPVVASSRYGSITFGGLTLEECDQLFLDPAAAPVPSAGTPVSSKQWSPPSSTAVGTSSTASKERPAKERPSSSTPARASASTVLSARGNASNPETKVSPRPAGALESTAIELEMQEDQALAQLMLQGIFQGRGGGFLLSSASDGVATLPGRAQPVKEEAAREDLMAPGAPWEGLIQGQGLQGPQSTGLPRHASASVVTARAGEGLGGGRHLPAQGGSPEWVGATTAAMQVHSPIRAVPTPSLSSPSEIPALPQLVLRRQLLTSRDPSSGLPAGDAPRAPHLPYAARQALVPALAWPGREAPQLPGQSVSTARRPGKNGEPAPPRASPAEALLGAGVASVLCRLSPAESQLLWDQQVSAAAALLASESTSAWARSLPGISRGTVEARPLGVHVARLTGSGLQSTGALPLAPQSSNAGHLHPGQVGVPATQTASTLYGVASGTPGIGATSTRPGDHLGARGPPAVTLRQAVSTSGILSNRAGSSWVQNSWGGASALRGPEAVRPQAAPAPSRPQRLASGPPTAPNLASFLGLPGRSALLGPYSNALPVHQPQPTVHREPTLESGPAPSSQREGGPPHVQRAHPGAASLTRLSPSSSAITAGAPAEHPGAALLEGAREAGPARKRQVHSAGHAALARGSLWVHQEAACGQQGGEARVLPRKRSKSLPPEPEPSGSPGHEALRGGASTAPQTVCLGEPGAPGTPTGPGSSSLDSALAPSQRPPATRALASPLAPSSIGPGGCGTSRALGQVQQESVLEAALTMLSTGQLQPLQSPAALGGRGQPHPGSPGAWLQEPSTAVGVGSNRPSVQSSHGQQSELGQVPMDHEGPLQDHSLGGYVAQVAFDLPPPSGVLGGGQDEDIEKLVGSQNLFFDDVLQQAMSLADDLETQLNEGP